MKYIKRIETEECDHGNAFDIVYLDTGQVIVINKERIGIFMSEEEFNSAEGDPIIIELDDDINLKNLN